LVIAVGVKTNTFGIDRWEDIIPIV
jgi:NADH dehydrogenase FAD-containing subunit